MGNGVTIRPYEAGDEEGILVLLRRVFGGSRDGQWWEWLYAKNPAGRSIIWVAVDGEDIVGHMASLAVKIRLPGVSRPSQSRVGVVGQVIDSVVYPRYRRQGVMSKLMLQAEREAREKGWAFHYGCPNQYSHPLRKKLGSVDLFEAPRLLRILNHKEVAG